MLLSSSCLVLPAVVKQQQEDISPNHVLPSLFAIFFWLQLLFALTLKYVTERRPSFILLLRLYFIIDLFPLSEPSL